MTGTPCRPLDDRAHPAAMIRKARIDEVPEIRRMLAEFSREGDVLPRTLASLYSHLRDYYVWREEAGPIVGIVALHITWDGLGEIRSLVVVPERQRQGLGTALVARCLEEARELGLRRVFALTTTPGFFGRFGFRPIAKEALPPIVWADCVECVKFPDCDELPVILDLEPKSGAPGEGGESLDLIPSR